MQIKGEPHWNSGMPLLSEGQGMLVYVWNSFDEGTQLRKALPERNKVKGKEKVKGTRHPSKKTHTKNPLSLELHRAKAATIL